MNKILQTLGILHLLFLTALSFQSFTYLSKNHLFDSEHGKAKLGSKFKIEGRNLPKMVTANLEKPKGKVSQPQSNSNRNKISTREIQINKELGVKQRKLRQIFDLEVQYRTDPDSLNEDQLDKLERKDELLGLIASLESERRSIRSERRKEEGPSTKQGKNKEPPVPEAPPMPKKLGAFLVWARVCSSDLAMTLTALGKVRVNGQEILDPDYRINAEVDEITVSGNVVKPTREMNLWREDQEKNKDTRNRRPSFRNSRVKSTGPPDEKQLMRMYMKFNGGIPRKPKRD